MLIPRFSLRWLLWLTTVSALVSLVLSFAVRGRAWALGITAGLWCLVAVFVFFVLAFLAAWLVANTKAGFRSVLRPQDLRAAGESPFAQSAVIKAPAAESPPAMTG
jgi:hypothetical protein